MENDTYAILKPPELVCEVVSNDPAAANSLAHDENTLNRVANHDFTVPETATAAGGSGGFEKIKQAWLLRALEVTGEEDSFTPYVSKSRKKQLRLAHSTGSHHTRSKGPLPHSQ